MILILTLFIATPIHAELLDCSQIDANNQVDAPGGCIAKSLSDQIGAGHGDEFTPGSSVYLIKRDPARSIRRGRQLFQRKFSATEGQGPRVSKNSAGDITETRALGAGLTDSCAACHGRPRGAAGFGGDVATRPDSRDAPHLFGLGLVEQLADEMTMELRAIRQQAIQRAVKGTGRKITQSLVAKGIDFGSITALPDGSMDSSAVSGVNPDLRLRPFFHEGSTISIREFITGAFKDEMGLEVWDPILCAVTDPNNPTSMASPAGFGFDPAEDSFQRPPTCSAAEDKDRDGVKSEIDPALLDHVEFYLLNYFKPGQYQVTSRAKRGLKLLHRIGCTDCHVQQLSIDQDRRVADVSTRYDTRRGIFNELFATAQPLFERIDDGESNPLQLPIGKPFLVDNFFSDLKRHDLGPAFHEREYDGSLVTEFVTEPLWGVATTAPYGHDGRSINLDAVIRRHGGEAQLAKRRYENLGAGARRRILEFLQTLVLFPPDDTASNLNPGRPKSATPQHPADHGSINLGALFLIPDEGGE